MAPGGSAFKEVLEAVADCDIATSKSENNIIPIKGTVSLSGKQGVYSNNGVHELLGCPVCTNLMYPPIHQVRSQLHGFFSFILAASLKQHANPTFF